MLFNSAIFLILFFFVYVIYWPLPTRGKQYLIIITSLLFYAWYSIPLLLLFLFLIVVNYAVSQHLLTNKNRLLLGLTVALDLSVLGFYKYFYLFAESFGWLLGDPYIADLRANWMEDYGFQIVLPIAISFYTFQIIAFVVDCYRGTVSGPVEPRKFVLFILFFPQFVAGPIMRADDFIGQIDRPTPSKDRIVNGSLYILMGVVKKVLIADHIGAASDVIWADPARYDAVYLFLILPSFVVRIYCDFSGYTDMARGLAKLLGYEIPENFKGPFLAKSMAELWTRWHITLSTWLRDYIYIPLGGSRAGEWRTNINVMITMGLGGLWHGANWTMLCWGLFVGIFLVIERFFRNQNIRLLPRGRFGDVFRVAYAFGGFALSSAFFKAPDISASFEIFYGLFTMQRGDKITNPDALVVLTIVGFMFNFVQYYDRPRQWLNERPDLRKYLLFFGTFFVGYLVYLYGDVSGSFIYFAF